MKTKEKARSIARALRATGVLALLFLCLLGGGCLEKKGPAADDLSEARSALAKRNYLAAEKALERYLRANPDSPERWEIWKTLVDISLQIRHDRRSAIELLEAMYIEYENDPVHLREVELLLARQYRQEGKYERAEALWGGVTEDEKALPETRAQAHRDLADIYLQRLEFERAKESLGNCLALDISQPLRAQCLYDLSEVYMATDELEPAAEQLRALLVLTELSDDIRLLSIFMLADTIEQQNDLPAAKALFESIRDTYPNRKVIEKRITFLEEKLARATNVRRPRK